MGSAWRKASV
jgi:hypothetical protein